MMVLTSVVLQWSAVMFHAAYKSTTSSAYQFVLSSNRAGYGSIIPEAPNVDKHPLSPSLSYPTEYLVGLRIAPSWIENPGCFSELSSMDGSAPTYLAFVLCSSEEAKKRLGKLFCRVSIFLRLMVILWEDRNANGCSIPCI